MNYIDITENFVPIRLLPKILLKIIGRLFIIDLTQLYNIWDIFIIGSNVVGGALNKCGARMIPAITQLPLSLTSTLNTTTTVHSTSALNPAVSTPVLSTSIIKSDSSHNQPGEIHGIYVVGKRNSNGFFVNMPNKMGQKCGRY